MPHPVIDYAKAKGKEKELSDIVNICPVNVFAVQKGKLVVKNPEACIGCRACEAQAPNGSITVVD